MGSEVEECLSSKIRTSNANASIKAPERSVQAQQVPFSSIRSSLRVPPRPPKRAPDTFHSGIYLQRLARFWGPWFVDFLKHSARCYRARTSVEVAFEVIESPKGVTTVRRQLIRTIMVHKCQLRSIRWSPKELMTS